MTGQVLEAVVAALAGEGYLAVREFPFASRRPEGPLICVSPGECRWVQAGMGGYMGQRREADGSITEIFGRRMEMELIFGVYVPFCDEGEGLCRATADALTRAKGIFPSGLKVEKMTWGAMEAKEELGAYVLECRAECNAWFSAEAPEGQEEFLDFVLKGVVIGVDQQ